MGQTQQIGQGAEDLAEAYLIQQGLQPITRNVHFKTGEIDLIMRDQQSLVFVEVRFRKNSRFGSALESITRNKQQKLIRSALLYCQKHQIHSPWRIDVVAITPATPEREQQIDWIPSAISS